MANALGMVATLAEMNRRHLRLSATDVLDLLIALRSRGRFMRVVTLAHFLAHKYQQAKAQDFTAVVHRVSSRPKSTRRSRSARS
jgi:hypothetical protein